MGGSITASKTDPENLKSVGKGILSSLIGSPLSGLNLEEGKDKGKIIDLKEKKKQIKDSDPEPPKPEDDGKDVMTSLRDLQDLKEEFDKWEKEKQTDRRKENTVKKIFQEILPENIQPSARFEIMNKYGDYDFSRKDFMVFPEDGTEGRFATEEEVAQIQKDFNSLVDKITTFKKTGGMVDKAISYEPRY